MKITKGMKLTSKQKAQRKAARERNDAIVKIKQEIRQLQAISAEQLHINMDLKDHPEIKSALAWVEGKFFAAGVNHDPGTIALCLLNLALAHPEQLTQWINSLVKYRTSEGYDETKASDDKIVLGWIAGRKEYRTSAKA